MSFGKWRPSCLSLNVLTNMDKRKILFTVVFQGWEVLYSISHTTSNRQILQKYLIALKFDWHLCSCAADLAVRFLSDMITGLILGLRPANERRRYFVMTSLIDWAQT